MKAGIIAAAIFSLATSLAGAAEPLPKQLEGVELQQKLGNHVPLDLPFTNHNGERVTLRQLFADGKPILLTLNYYRCKTLCSLELGALLRGLRRLDYTPGREFKIITASIDHREPWSLAQGKRTSYLAEYGRGNDVDWSFLVGEEASVMALTSAVGFYFKYLPDQDQFAHQAVLFVLSPEGKIVRYLDGLGEGGPDGLTISSRDLRFALMDASNGKVGSFLEKFIQSCFHYDASLGKYSMFAMGVMRIGGGLTVLILAAVLASLWRKERQLKRVAQSA